MSCALFTGMTGQLGMPLSKRLREEKIPVACIVREGSAVPGGRLDGFSVLRADIRDREAVRALAGGLRGNVGVLVHMASVGPGSSREDLFKTIVSGTLNVYDLARETGCPRFLFLSSIAAGGWARRGEGAIDESTRIDGSRLAYFGRMKLEAERLLFERARSGGPAVTAIRIGNVYGPPKLSFIKTVASILKERNRIYYHRAKDSIPWAPVYIGDVLDCIMALVKRDPYDNRAYYLTGPDRPTLGELCRAVSDAAGISLRGLDLDAVAGAHLAVRRAIDAVRAASGRPSFPDMVFSTERIRADLGIEPKTRLSDKLRPTVEWALSEGLL